MGLIRLLKKILGLECKHVYINLAQVCIFPMTVDLGRICAICGEYEKTSIRNSKGGVEDSNSDKSV